jgi:hypothetical protein
MILSTGTLYICENISFVMTPVFETSRIKLVDVRVGAIAACRRDVGAGYVFGNSDGDFRDRAAGEGARYQDSVTARFPQSEPRLQSGAREGPSKTL